MRRPTQDRCHQDRRRRAEERLFSLDPEQSRQEQYRRRYKLDVVQIPIMRVIGFVAMTLAALVYDLNLRPFPLSGFLTLSAINIGYALAAFVAVRALYDRAGRLDLTLLFLHVDVVVWLFTMHHVSAADQLFAFFLLVRVGDQVGFGFRRAFYFTQSSSPRISPTCGGCRRDR